MATLIPGKFRINDDGERVPVYVEDTAPPDVAPNIVADGVTGAGVDSASASAPGESEAPATTSARVPGKTKRGGNK